MFFMKVGAYLVTGSAAVLSDAMESVVHVLATLMAYISVLYSAKPADRCHPYGHGKIEFFSAGFEGGLILLAAVAILFAVSRGLVLGREITELDVGIAITAAAGAINLILGAYLISAGRKHDSLTLLADGKHVLTDSFTSIGVVVGLALVWLTKLQFFDPLVAALVALNIMVTGGRLIRESIRGLMDESDPETMERIVDTLNQSRRPAWIDIHHLRTFKSGEVYHVDFHMTVPRYWEINTGHDEEEAVANLIARNFKGKAETIVHLDPCVPGCCSFCKMEGCPVRENPFVQQPPLTVNHVVLAAQYVIG